MAEKVDWADPGYFSGNSHLGNTVRILVQLVKPPRGHRTLPTKTGSLLILITIGVGTAGFNTGQNILYLALSMLLSTLLVSGLLSWINFKGCRWRLLCGRHFRVGAASPITLECHNSKKLLPSYSLTFQVHAKLCQETASLGLRERLDPGGKSQLLWDFVPLKRGKEIICLKGLVSRYPFGFLKKSISDSIEKEVLVWPKRISYEFNADQAGRRWMYGHHRRKGDGVELIHLRDYRSGDSLRKIHWKASARLGKLQTRETEQEHHKAFSLWVDPSPSVWQTGEQFERMCCFAATLAEDLFKKDQLSSAQIAGNNRISIGAIEDLYSFLDELACLEQIPWGNKNSGIPRNMRNAVRFLPGADNRVIARMEEGTIGEA